MERNSGIYEAINGQFHFYPTPFNAAAFTATAIQQQQQMVQYFLQRRLNPYALPYIPNIVLPTNNENTNTFNAENKNNQEHNNNINVHHTNSNNDINTTKKNTTTTTCNKHRRCFSDPPQISTPVHLTSEWITPSHTVKNKKPSTKEIPPTSNNPYSILSSDTQEQHTYYIPNTNNKLNSTKPNKPLRPHIPCNNNNDFTKELQEIDSVHQTIIQRLHLSSVSSIEENTYTYKEQMKKKLTTILEEKRHYKLDLLTATNEL